LITTFAESLFEKMVPELWSDYHLWKGRRDNSYVKRDLFLPTLGRRWVRQKEDDSDEILLSNLLHMGRDTTLQREY
jgi:hypothetical protein